MKLTMNDCFNGFKISLENSKNFIDDAKILFKKGSYGHSLGLSMLAMEECGKAILLWGVTEGITTLDKELSKFVFKDHVAKIFTALKYLALDENFPENEIEYIKTLAPKLDSAKQRGFYVDYINHKWVTPQDEDLIDIARINLDYAERVSNSLLEYVF